MHYTFVLAQTTSAGADDNATLKDAKAGKDGPAGKDGKDGKSAAPAKDAPTKDAPTKDAAKTGTKDEAGKETATKQEDNKDAWYNQGAMGKMVEGGLFMWPILLLGVLATGVMIERYRSLKMLRTDNEGLREDVYNMLQQDRAEDALNRIDDDEGPIPAILGAGIRKYVVLRRLNHDSGRIEEQVVKAMDDYAVHIVAALERHLPILATIASVAPMIGFLGTVSGMIEAFTEMEERLGKENILKLAAGGIKVALLTTAFGLIIGIPAFMAYNYFTGIINRFVLDVEETATDLIEKVTLQNAIDEGTREDA